MIESSQFKKSYVYILTIIIVSVSSIIFNNIGSDYVKELLNTNLQYTCATIQGKTNTKIVCSMKNTGYRTINNIKIVMWNNCDEENEVDYNDEEVSIIQESVKKLYTKIIFQLKHEIYPEEIKTLTFIINKNIEQPNKDIQFNTKIYSEKSPGIKTKEINKATAYKIGPYLNDLLWTIAWIYIDIGVFIVLPLSIVIFTIFTILSKFFLKD